MNELERLRDRLVKALVKRVPGDMRNKPCPCGSGAKAKSCRCTQAYMESPLDKYL